MPVIYTNAMPVRFKGYTIGPVILIRPDYKDDKGLLAHEQVHVRQFWDNPVLHGFLYKFSKPYRLKCELEAYAVQCRESDLTTDKAAEFIASNYNLDIDQAEAKKLMLEELCKLEGE